jgi:hypothetical protein
MANGTVDSSALDHQQPERQKQVAFTITHFVTAAGWRSARPS